MQLQFYTLVLYHYPHLSFSLGHSCVLALVMKPLTGAVPAACLMRGCVSVAPHLISVKELIHTDTLILFCHVYVAKGHQRFLTLYGGNISDTVEYSFCFLY